MTTLVEEKRPFTVTEAAGQLVAGRPHDGVGSTVQLTPTEARYELLLGAIVPDGVPVMMPPPIGPVSSIDGIAATRGAKEWDFAVVELAEFLVGAGLGDAIRAAVLGDVPPDRDSLAELSAALDAAVLLLRTAIQARAPAPSDPLVAQAMEARWTAYSAGLPVWSGSGPAPVPPGKPFLQGPGGPILIAQ